MLQSASSSSHQETTLAAYLIEVAASTFEDEQAREVEVAGYLALNETTIKILNLFNIIKTGMLAGIEKQGDVIQNIYIHPYWFKSASKKTLLRNHQEEKYEYPPEHEAIQMVELSSDGSYLKMIRQLGLEKLAKCITFLVKGIALFQKQTSSEKATASTSSSSSSISRSSSSEATDPSNPEQTPSSHKAMVIKPADFTKLKGNVRNFQKVCHQLKFGLITEVENVAVVFIHEAWSRRFEMHETISVIFQKESALREAEERETGQQSLPTRCLVQQISSENYAKMIEGIFNICLYDSPPSDDFSERTYPDGRKEEGLFLYDCLHGPGKRTYPNGKIKEGEFHYGSLHGPGRVSQDGSLLKQGNFVYGRLNGQGIEIHPTLGRIEGKFREGILHGQGTIRSPNRKIAQGEFKGYLLNGRGKMVFPGGETHQGEFVEGNLIRGRVTTPTGRIYTGQFKACALDKKEGACSSSSKSSTGISLVRGRVLFPNGDWFELGPGQDDSRGNRKITLPNGDVLKGYIENDELIRGIKYERCSDGVESRWRIIEINTYESRHLYDAFLGSMPSLSGASTLGLPQSFLLENCMRIADKEGNTYLHLICSQGNVEVLRQTMNSGLKIDLEVKNRQGNTPLIEAIISRREIIIELLLQAEVKTGYSEDNGLTALHASVKTRMPGIIKTLLLHGADTTVTVDREGNTYLHELCAMGNIEILKLILESKKPIDLDVRNYSGTTPLIEAFNGNHLEIVRLLLEYGAETTGCDGWTALHAALKSGELSIVRDLLNRGAKLTVYDPSKPGRYHAFSTGYVVPSNYQVFPNLFRHGIEDGSLFAGTPLHYALRMPNEPIAIELIKYAKTHQPEAFEMASQISLPAFTLACSNPHFTRAVAATFLDIGTDPNIHNALHSSCFYNPDIASFLLEQGAWIVHGSISQPISVAERRVAAKIINPIMTATMGAGTKELIQQLISAGDNPHFVCPDGKNALYYATMREDSKSIVELLLNYQVNPNQRMHDRSETPLNNAVQKESVQTVEMLLQHKASPNDVITIRTTHWPSPLEKVSHTTALFTAISKMNAEIISILLKYGANPSTKNDAGNTPLQEYMRSHAQSNPIETVLKITKLFIQEGNVKIDSGLKEVYDGYLKSHPNEELRQLVDAKTPSSVIAVTV